MRLEVNYLIIVPPIMVCLILNYLFIATPTLTCSTRWNIQASMTSWNFRNKMSKKWNFHASVTSWTFRDKINSQIIIQVQHMKEKDPYKTSIKQRRRRITQRKEIQTERHGSSSKHLRVFLGMTYPIG